MPKKKGESHSQWINRIARKLSARRERKSLKAESKGERSNFNRPMTRKTTPKLATVEKKLKRLIAYDLETTSIKAGTPCPLYLTACGADIWVSTRVQSLSHLGELIINRFLIPEFVDCRFVAWNGNKFDVYLIAVALLKSPDYILRPYLTRSKNLRGLRVVKRQFENGVEITDAKGTKPISWEFLDGMSMTGITKPLKSRRDETGKIIEKGFLATFAPKYDFEVKIDFETEGFDPLNPEHVRYAERDSEGLYVAMEKARDIVLKNFSIDLCPTIGNMGIKIFQRFIPKMVECWRPPASALKAIRSSVMRGGYCWHVQRYRGPIWKYDINQAYASAMRETNLPAGRCMHTAGLNKYAQLYIARVSGKNFKNRVPFYYRENETGRAIFGLQEIADCWLTSIEIEQLQKEGWALEIKESWFWDSKFRMRDYVNTLEFLRVGVDPLTGAKRDPKDAQGEMVKAIGNNSYGKTVEQLEGVDLVMAAEQPEGFAPYKGADEDGLDYIWFKFGEPMIRDYHQPQIGAFITAQVRMVVRRAALLNPDAWLYADTDCVMFKCDMKHALDIDGGRYGAWKIEDENKEYIIAVKKGYCAVDESSKHAKGLNIRHLKFADYERWIAGESPRQTQVQRQNFVKVISGFDMFIEREKVGENFSNTKKREAKKKAG